MRGQNSIVELLLSYSRSEYLNMQDSSGMTPLHFAIINDHHSTAELLLRLGSTCLDTPNNEGMTPFHYSAMLEHDSTAKLLVQWGTTCVDTPDKEGTTPIHYAAVCGRDCTFELILRWRSACSDTPNNDGMTPLFFAAINGRDSTVELLLRRGSTCFDIDTSLKAAAWYNRTSTARIFRAVGATMPTIKSLRAMNPSLFTPIDGDSILEIRYRIYFSQSLLSELLHLL